MMNRLQIRLGGPYFAAFLVNRMTIDLQNRQNLSAPRRIFALIPISPTGSQHQAAAGKSLHFPRSLL
jgi:hypothetical protein